PYPEPAGCVNHPFLLRRPPFTSRESLTMHATSDDFTSILVRRKVLTEAQLYGARLLQRQTNDSLRSVLVEFGYATAEQVRTAVFEQGGWETIDLTNVVIPQPILKLIPEAVAREYVAMPLRLNGDILWVVVTDPTDRGMLDRLQSVLHLDIHALSA